MSERRLEPYRGPFDEHAAAHLLVRTGMGATPTEVAAAVQDGLEATLDRVFQSPSARAPEQRRWQRLRQLGDGMARRKGIEGLRALWLRRMIECPIPFREHLALFWHDHFATGAMKVDDPVSMSRQNALFIDQGCGLFDDLVLEIARDPAMLVWLDSAASDRRHPNENFARELMELFTLGLGEYDEMDIRAAARAFTGWQVKQGSFHFSAAAHDDGEKTVLGVSGRLSGEDVVRACVERPASARFIAGKLYRWFVADDVDDRLAKTLADTFQDEERHVGRFLRRLFASRAFFDRDIRGRLIRSPSQLVVGALRTLSARVDALALDRLVVRMGETLFEPPSVAGWDRGPAWINSATLIARHDFGAAIAAGESGPLSCRLKSENDLSMKDLVSAFLRRDPPREDRRRVLASDSVLAAAGAMLALPEAQLM